MPTTKTRVDALDEQAMALPPELQGELARRIIERLDLGDDECDDDELRRRIDEIERGTAETYSAEEVFAELRARFG